MKWASGPSAFERAMLDLGCMVIVALILGGVLTLVMAVVTR